MRHLCRKCAAKQRADNIKAFEAHRASRSDGWPADRRDHAGSADSNPRPKIGNVY